MAPAVALKYTISYYIEKKVVSLFIAQTHNLEREHKRSNQQVISFGYLWYGRGVSGLNLLSKLLQPAAAGAKLLHSCPTLCDPIDGSPTGSPIPGILQARTLEWVAISFSNTGK